MTIKYKCKKINKWKTLFNLIKCVKKQLDLYYQNIPITTFKKTQLDVLINLSQRKKKSS